MATACSLHPSFRGSLVESRPSGRQAAALVGWEYRTRQPFPEYITLLPIQGQLSSSICSLAAVCALKGVGAAVRGCALQKQ